MSSGEAFGAKRRLKGPDQGRVLVAPTVAHERQIGFADLRLLGGVPFGAAAREGAVDNELGDTLRMEYRMGDSGRAALRNTEQGVALELLCRNHRLKVPTEGRERQFVDVPVRQAVAAPVIADEVMPACEEVQQRATDRVVPFILEMVEPGERARARNPDRRAPSRD